MNKRNILNVNYLKTPKKAALAAQNGVGQFGAAVSAMVVANVLCEKMCVFEIL